jgi:hypothetical protein
MFGGKADWAEQIARGNVSKPPTIQLSLQPFGLAVCESRTQTQAQGTEHALRCATSGATGLCASATQHFGQWLYPSLQKIVKVRSASKNKILTFATRDTEEKNIDLVERR